MMDSLLKQIMVCPRDNQELREEDNNLVCTVGHTYPLIDGVPVMLLGEIEQTGKQGSNTIKQVAEGRFEGARSTDGEIDPHVQFQVAGTNGYLYKHLIGKLHRYPIPHLRLQDGDGRLFLDIGCNWGRWSVSAARKGYKVVGIDPSLNAVMSARRVARQLGVEATYVIGDARHLPFRPKTFDVCFSYSVLQHLSKENVKLCIAEIARVVKPGGTSFIQMPNMFGVRSLYHQVRRGFRQVSDFGVRYWRPAEVKRAFSFIGPTSLSVDGYFGLGIQASDLDILPTRYQIVVRASEVLRAASQRMPWMVYIADSVYLTSVRSE